MKKTRKARKQAKARQTRLGQIKHSIAMVTVTLVTAAAPIAEASASEPIVEMVQVEEPAPPADPIPWSVPTSTRTIPPPPESGVRRVEPQPSQEQPKADLTRMDEEEPCTVDTIDRERLFDFQVRSLLGICLSVDDVLRMYYFVSLRDFLTHGGWSIYALHRMHKVKSVMLWDGRVPTAAGEEVWHRFRQRIRREGAHTRIAYNRIGTGGPPHLYSFDFKPRRVA